MSDTPENASDTGSIDQSAIDAMFGGGSETPSEPATPAQAPAGEIDQSDIDALLGGGSSDRSESASDAGEEAGIDQGDIDALMAAASGEAPSATAEDAAPAEPDMRVDTLGRPFDEVAAAMQAAIEEEAASTPAPVAPSPQPPPPDSQPFSFPSFEAEEAVGVDPARVTMLNDVNLGVRIELGRTKMLVEDVLCLDEGSVVELDRLAGDPVDVFANDRLVARGEVLVLNDSFCVRISEVFSRDPHRVVQ